MDLIILSIFLFIIFGGGWWFTGYRSAPQGQPYGYGGLGVVGVVVLILLVLYFTRHHHIIL